MKPKKPINIGDEVRAIRGIRAKQIGIVQDKKYLEIFKNECYLVEFYNNLGSGYLPGEDLEKI